MKKNVGTIDAIMRITLGLTGVAWGTSRMIRDPYSSTPVLITLASAMKVAEGITRYCPMLALFNVNSENLVDKAQNQPLVKRITRLRNETPNQPLPKQEIDDLLEPHH